MPGRRTPSPKAAPAAVSASLSSRGSRLAVSPHGASRKSARCAARVVTESTETVHQDERTFQGLAQSDQGEGEEEAQQGAREQEQAAAEIGTTSSSSRSVNKKKKDKKNTSLKKLEPKGEWKMYDNLSVDNDRRNEQGRVQRTQDRPNYDETKPRVFGYDPDHAMKEKKKSGKKSASDKKAATGKKPRGRPPKGKVWDDDAGAYVSDEDAPVAKKAKTSAKGVSSAEKDPLLARCQHLTSEVAGLQGNLSTLRAELAEMRAKVSSFTS